MTPSASATPDLDLARLIPHACYPMATLYGLGILENSLPVIDAGQGMGALTVLGRLMTSLASVVTPPAEVQRFWAEGRAAPSFQQYVATHPEQAAATIVATVGQATAAFSLLEEQFRTWGDEARAGSRAAVLASFLGATQLGRTGPFRSETDQLSLLQSELTRMSSEQTSLAAAVQALATQGQPRAGQPAVHFADRAPDPTGNPNSGPRPTPMVMDPPAHPAPPVPAQTPSSGWTTVTNKRARPRTPDRPDRPPSRGQKRPKPADKDKGKGRAAPAPAQAAPPAPAPASGTAPAPTYAAATAAGQPSAPAAPATSPTTPTPDKPKPKVEVAQRFKTPTLTLFAEGLDRLVSTSQLTLSLRAHLKTFPHLLKIAEEVTAGRNGKGNIVVKLRPNSSRSFLEPLAVACTAWVLPFEGARVVHHRVVSRHVTFFARRVPFRAADSSILSDDLIIQELRQNNILATVPIFKATWTDSAERLAADPNRHFAVLQLVIEDQLGRVETALKANNKLLFYGTKIKVEPPYNRPVFSQCDNCQALGHLAKACKNRSVRCGICAGVHHTNKHRQLCEHCRREGVTAVECPHPPLCVNCGGTHRSNSTMCPERRHYATPPSKSISLPAATTDVTMSAQQQRERPPTPGPSTARATSLPPPGDAMDVARPGQ